MHEPGDAEVAGKAAVLDQRSRAERLGVTHLPAVLEPAAGPVGRDRAGGRGSEPSGAGVAGPERPPAAGALTVYAKCLDGQQATYNERIGALLDA